MKRKLFCLMLFLSGLFVHQSTKAQTLAAGDIAFVGYHTDSDDGFTFIALTDIPAGEVIYFTDKGWNATNAVWYANAEDHIIWTSPGGGTSMGTVVSIIETTGDTFTASQGTAVLSGTDSGFSMLGGDSILAYQSSSGAQPANPTFIAGIYGDDNYVHTLDCDDTSGWLNCSTCTHVSGSCTTTSGDTSGLPASLTNGVNAIALFPNTGEEDNAKYTGTLTGTVSVIRAEINNPANWTTNDSPINIASTEYSGINITADVVSPTVSSVSVPVGSTYVTGQNLNFIVNFSENVTVNTGGGIPQLEITVGSETRNAVYLAGSGTQGLLFRYTVQAGDVDTDGIAVGTLSANGGTIQSSGGDDADLTLNSVGNTSNVYVDATAPTVSSVSVPVSSTYISGQSLNFIVNFNENVTVNTGGGTPQLSITVGSDVLNAVYLSGSGTQGLLFRYTIQAGDVDTDGIAVGTLSANGGTIKDNGGNSANLTLNSVGNTSNVFVDATVPTVSSVSVPVSSTYVTGQSLNFIVNFNENVTVNTGGGTPQLAITIGSDVRNAVYLSGSGTQGLLFRYTVQAGDQDTDGIAVGTLSANGGTIKDNGGNSANLTLNSVGNTSNVFVGCDLSASGIATHVSCNGGSNGAVDLTVTGGTAPYTFAWSNSAVTEDLSGLIASTYSVTVTDANGCTATTSVDVEEPAILSANGVATHVSCNGGSNGAVDLTVVGGNPPYTYAWSNSAVTEDLSGLTAATYSVTVTDSKGCTATTSVDVEEPAILSANGVATHVNCNGGSNGAVDLTVVGGNPPYTFAWSNSAVTEDLSGLTAATYSVTVTDAKGCTATTSVDVEEPAILSANGVATNVSCNGGSNGAVDLTVVGGNPPYTYAWSNSAVTEDISGLIASTYSVTVTDSKGCTATTSVDVFEPIILEAHGVGTNESCAGNDGSINLSVLGGNPPYTYAWSNTATTEDLSGLAPGTYDVTVTDSKGCTATESVTINAATGCETIATVTTDAITVYNESSFIVGGNVTDDGNATVTDRGILIGGAPNPTTADTVIQMGSGEGAFSQSVLGLISGVTYYVRAYAINSEGIAYGNEIVFTAPYGVINLIHDATTTQYPTIQQAVDASVTGDMITLGAGTYIEQVTVTTGITIQGAGTGLTIVRSPLAADLTVNGGWKTLKAQDVVAVIGIKTNDASQVTIKDLTVDGFDQGYLPDGTYPDKNAYAFQGIGALNTNLTVDNVIVRGVRELATDFGATIPAGYLPADQPSGLNHNEAIFAESAVGAGSHTLEVKNSYIEKFQKTAILAWGPTLEVNIHDNTIQGYGQTLYSTGNGIQIASTDRTSLGGDNGDRRGTTGIITNNQILGIGVVIPEPGEDGSYLNLGMYGPSAILPYEAGDNFVISNNTITRTPYQSWYNDYISNDGGFSNAAIAVYNSNNASVTGNTISGFDVAIAEIGALNGSEFNASGNTVSDNRNDYFTAQNNDHIVLGSSAETLTYYATSTGVDLIDNFGVGDRINVVGMEAGSINGELSGTLIVDFTSGTVTAGDGSTVAANSIQVQQNATTTTLFIDTDATEDQAELELELTGLYEVGNFNLDGGFIVFAVLPPTASAQSFCDAATVADLDATGTDLQWYDVATGGTALANDVDLATGTYYVSQTVSGVESDRTSVAVTINISPVASGVATNVSCNGGTNGTIDLTVTGGAAPYTFVWSNTAVTEDLTDLSAGTYDVTVTDANGCTATASVEVTEPTVLMASGVATNVSCNGGTNGTVDLTVNGGTAPYTFAWSNTAVTEDLTDLGAGTYDVTVTDSKGCTATTSVEVTEPAVLMASGVATTVSCNGGTNGTIDLTVNGGTAPYTFAWSNTAITEDLTDLGAGTYDVTVTDSKGCTATTSVEVTEPAVLMASGVATTVSCNGGTNGTIDLTVNGGTAPYTFAWSNTAVTEDLTDLGAGTYDVTVTDAKGCTATTSVEVTEPTVLVASGVVDANVNCNGGNDGAATINVTGGTAPYSYNWDGISASAVTFVSQGFESSGSWNYILDPAVYNTEGDPIVSGSEDVWNIIEEFTSPSVLPTEGTHFFGMQDLNNPNGGGDFAHTITFEAIDVSAKGDMTLSFDYYTFEYDTPDVIEYFVEFDNGTTWTTPVALNKNTGAWETITVNVPASANFVRLRLQATQDGGGDYAAFDNVVLSEVEPQGASMTDLAAGTYDVTVTDANGCTATASVTITQPDLLEASTVVDTNVSCNGGTTGSATINLTGGTAPFEYTINGTTYSGVPDATLAVSGLSEGTYPVSVTDANGCTATSSVTITQPDVLEASGVATNVSCNGGSNGTVDLTVTGGTAPYTFVWSNTATTEDLTGLMAGTYEVTVTDANGCTATTSVEVTEPTVLSASGIATDVNCNGGSDGTIDLTVTGGTAPYEYEWDNTATTEDLTGLMAGTYGVTVTDANGCTATTSVTVEEPTVLVAAGVVDTNVTCNGGSDGSATVNVTGGVGPYEYEWDNTATTASITGVMAGTYEVTVTDANGCTATASVTITESEAIVVNTVVDTNVSCFNGNDGSVTINLTNGVAPFEYTINGTTYSGVPDATLFVDGLPVGTYPIAITDANGCTATDSVTITEPAEVMPPAADAQVFCNFATVADIAVTGTDVQWYADETGGTPLAGTASLSTGTYYATQTVDGCESPTRTAVAITVNITPAPSASAQTFCNAATVAELTASGTDVQWYAAATGGTALAGDTALATATYYVSQTLNDCESTRTAVSVTVNVTPAPTADAQVFCNSATVADLVATGTDLKWYANETGGVQLVGTANLATGTYYVSQTLNACEGPRTAVAVTVNVTPAPAAVAQVFCNSATVADLVATGTDVQWYTAATGGTALAGDTALATGTYYASQTLNDCESATRTAVAVTVNVTAAPTADAQIFCNSATVGDLVATGTAIQWYADETGGTALAGDTALATGTYYASQILNSCESPRVAVSVTVNVTDAPAADAQVFCNSATVADLVATGTDIQWYADETGGTALAGDAALATGTYYVSQTMNDCESPRAAVSVTVNVTPAPVADAQAFCDAATVADLMATGDNLQWFADETGGTALAGDVALTNGTTYYVSQTIDGCESATRTAVAVTITTTAAPAADNQTLCEGSTIADLVATGTGVQWYNDEIGGAPLSSDMLLTDGATYYATQTIDGCESATRTAAAVTITVTAAPTGDSTQTNGPEDTLADLVVDGTDIVWYANAEDAAAHVNPLDPATVLEDGVIYYATQTIDGCESQASLAVTVTISLRVDTFTKDKLSYYPVPVVDVLNIENTNRINNVTFINLLGQVVLTQDVNATSARIDMRALQGATYIMQVTTDSGIITVKVIKNSN